MSIGATATGDCAAANVRRARLDVSSPSAGGSPPLYSGLATACVAPRNHFGSQRIDPALRVSRLLDRISSAPSWLCDAQDIPPILGRKALQTTNTSMFIASRAFFDGRIRHLYRRMQQLPRRSHVENLIYDELRQAHRPGGEVCLRLPINCEPLGVGGNGEALASFGRRMKSSIRGLARRIAPRIWL